MTDAETRAHAAIRDTLGRCSQAGDARRADAYADCFAADAVLELSSRRYEGRDAIRAWLTAPSVIPPPAGTPAGFVSHHLTSCRIDLTGLAEAKVRTYWLVVTAVGLDHSGYYDDRFVREGERWLIAERRPRTLWVAADSLTRSR